MSVSVRLSDDLDISRGDLLCAQQRAGRHPGRRRHDLLVQ